MAPPHFEFVPAAVPGPDDLRLDRPLEHVERMAFQLELARRMADLGALGIPAIDTRDPQALVRLQGVLDALDADPRAMADERMAAWAMDYMDGFRDLVGRSGAEGAEIRRLIRTDPETALHRVATLLRERRPH